MLTRTHDLACYRFYFVLLGSVGGIERDRLADRVSQESGAHRAFVADPVLIGIGLYACDNPDRELVTEFEVGDGDKRANADVIDRYVGLFQNNRAAEDAFQ